mgnify:CR=1 FL=1
MHLEAWQWLWVALGAFAVGMAKTGISGLGMLAVAIFANLLPTKESSGFVLPLLIFGDLVAVTAYRKHTQWRHVARLFPGTAIGVVAGYLAMGRISDAQASVIIGAIITGMVAIQLWRRWRAKDLNPEALGYGFAAVMGVLAGFTTLIANAAGPLMALYLLAMRLPKMEYVGTAAMFFLLLNVFKVPFMMDLGLINASSLSTNVILAPVVVLGALAGRWVLRFINQKLFENLALAVSALAGLKLLF